VYKLEYEGLILYVGKTKDMRNRYYQHCCRENNSCGSRDIPLDMQWKMVLLEECEDVSGASREQFYYDALKPLYNIKRPGQTQKEYRRAHPEVHREVNRKYQAAHPEQRREAYRKYRAANRETLIAKQREYRETRRAKKQLNAVPTTPPQTEVAV
jgi:hypothetical protein